MVTSKREYLANTDISAMQSFDYLWNAESNTEDTSYLCKLYLDFNNAQGQQYFLDLQKKNEFKKGEKNNATKGSQPHMILHL